MNKCPYPITSDVGDITGDMGDIASDMGDITNDMGDITSDIFLWYFRGWTLKRDDKHSYNPKIGEIQEKIQCF